MTVGEIRKALKGLPSNKKVLLQGYNRDGRKIGNLFNLISFDNNRNWDDICGVFETDCIIDFKALCYALPKDESLELLRNIINKSIDELEFNNKIKKTNFGSNEVSEIIHKYKKKVNDEIMDKEIY